MVESERGSEAAAPPPMRIGGFSFEWGRRTYVMGVLNITPDSFSGDGVTDVAAASVRARELVAAGADILDIGGESTRPGAQPVSLEEELRRPRARARYRRRRRLSRSSIPRGTD